MILETYLIGTYKVTESLVKNWNSFWGLGWCSSNCLLWVFPRRWPRGGLEGRKERKEWVCETCSQFFQSRCTLFCLIIGVSHILFNKGTTLKNDSNIVDVVQPPCLQMRKWNSIKVKGFAQGCTAISWQRGAKNTSPLFLVQCSLLVASYYLLHGARWLHFSDFSKIERKI